MPFDNGCFRFVKSGDEDEETCWTLELKMFAVVCDNKACQRVVTYIQRISLVDGDGSVDTVRLPDIDSFVCHIAQLRDRAERQSDHSVVVQDETDEERQVRERSAPVAGELARDYLQEILDSIWTGYRVLLENDAKQALAEQRLLRVCQTELTAAREEVQYHEQQIQILQQQIQKLQQENAELRLLLQDRQLSDMLARDYPELDED